VSFLGTELTWRPVRQALGAQIVGIAAFSAARAGREVVEAHSEVVDGRDHEEVYGRGRSPASSRATPTSAPLVTARS
jgi:hypothetical protein